MKAILLAATIVLTVVVTAWLLLRTLLVPLELVSSVTGVLLATFAPLHKRLDKVVSPAPIPAYSPETVVGLQGFALPPVVVFLYVIIFLLAATQAPAGIVGYIAGRLGVEGNPERLILGILSLVSLFLGFVIARWAGIRSGHRGVWVVVVPFSLCIAADHISRQVFFREDAAKLLQSGQPMVAWIQAIGGLILWNMIGLIGFWRGRRIQLRRYADYLLKKVTPDTREAILDLLRQEVERLRAIENLLKAEPVRSLSNE